MGAAISVGGEAQIVPLGVKMVFSSSSSWYHIVRNVNSNLTKRKLIKVTSDTKPTSQDAQTIKA